MNLTENIGFLLLTFLVVYCSSGESEPVTSLPEPIMLSYNITVSAQTGGTVNTSGGRFNAGENLTLIATAAEGYVFSGWSNGASSNSIQLTVISDLTIVANFTAIPTQTAVQSSTHVLSANGEDNTYALMTSFLAPGYSPLEPPDCNHESFGNHIDEVYDEALEKHVFRFHIHTTPDNDRCIKFDRQRNEIKTYDKSPENLLGRQGETVVYRWKLKLPEGFQSSPNFTHIHQLKSVGGNYESMPMYTLTTRKASPDRLELRYAETDSQMTLHQTPLSPLINTWIEATETIEYTTNGSYSIELVNLATGEVLFNYTNNQKVNWRPNGEFVRPKWGIYRSLINQQDLRDEQILFADFSFTEEE